VSGFGRNVTRGAMALVKRSNKKTTPGDDAVAIFIAVQLER
jgi:hypothetical protein